MDTLTRYVATCKPRRLPHTAAAAAAVVTVAVAAVAAVADDDS